MLQVSTIDWISTRVTAAPCSVPRAGRTKLSITDRSRASEDSRLLASDANQASIDQVVDLHPTGGRVDPSPPADGRLLSGEPGLRVSLGGEGCQEQ